MAKLVNVDVGLFPRQGVSLEEMSEQQKQAANAMLRASLSAKGLQLARNIMKTEQTLLEISSDAVRYGEEKYHFTIMGEPSLTEPWGWAIGRSSSGVKLFYLRGSGGFVASVYGR